MQGDNIFFGYDFAKRLRSAAERAKGATVLACAVHDTQRHGVVEFDEDRTAISLEEKPAHRKSRYAVTGVYFYDAQIVSVAESITPSPRGELAITDINRRYLEQGQLKHRVVGTGDGVVISRVGNPRGGCSVVLQIIFDAIWLGGRRDSAILPTRPRDKPLLPDHDDANRNLGPGDNGPGILLGSEPAPQWFVNNKSQNN